MTADDYAVVEFIDHPEGSMGHWAQDALRRELTIDGRVYGLLDLVITKDAVRALYAYIEDAT
jgi:hypothetical protein